LWWTKWRWGSFSLSTSGFPANHIFTTDLPTNIHTTTGAFADDTVILASHDDPVIASQRLQGHLDQLENWLKSGESTLMKPSLRRSLSH
jgi:hypothetical protein